MAGAFDPRIWIRNQIGYTKYMDGEDRSTVSVVDNRNDRMYLPLYLPGEVRTGDLPNMPFIEMVLVSSPAATMDIGGGIKDQESYLDFNIYYTHTSHVTPSEFGKTVADEIVTKILANRSSVASTYFVEVINSGREIIEAEEGKQVIFHRILEIKAKNYS